MNTLLQNAVTALETELGVKDFGRDNFTYSPTPDNSTSEVADRNSYEEQLVDTMINTPLARGKVIVGGWMDRCIIVQIGTGEGTWVCLVNSLGAVHCAYSSKASDEIKELLAVAPSTKYGVKRLIEHFSDKRPLV